MQLTSLLLLPVLLSLSVTALPQHPIRGTLTTSQYSHQAPLLHRRNHDAIHPPHPPVNEVADRPQYNKVKAINTFAVELADTHVPKKEPVDRSKIKAVNAGAPVEMHGDTSHKAAAAPKPHVGPKPGTLVVQTHLEVKDGKAGHKRR